MSDYETLACGKFLPHPGHVFQQGYKEFSCPGWSEPKRHVTVTWFDEHGTEVGRTTTEAPRAAAFMTVSVKFDHTVVSEAKLP